MSLDDNTSVLLQRGLSLGDNDNDNTNVWAAKSNRKDLSILDIGRKAVNWEVSPDNAVS